MNLLGQSTSCRRSKGAFTLLEVLLAFVLFAVLIAALHSILAGAMQLNERSTKAADLNHTRAHAENVIRRDLISCTSPGGTIPGDMTCVANGNFAAFEFFTTGAPYIENQSFGDIQKIQYTVQDFQQTNGVSTTALVRTIYRNLLSETEEPYSQEYLLPNVRVLQFYFYDGSSWQQAWDSTINDPSMPVAIKVHIEHLPLPVDEQSMFTSQQSQEPPIEITVPLVAISPGPAPVPTTASEETDGTENEGENNEGENNEGENNGGENNGSETNGGNNNGGPNDGGGGGRTNPPPEGGGR